MSNADTDSLRTLDIFGTFNAEIIAADRAPSMIGNDTIKSLRVHTEEVQREGEYVVAYHDMTVTTWARQRYTFRNEGNGWYLR